MPTRVTKRRFRDNHEGFIYGFLEAISIAGEGDGELARSQFVFDAILPSIHRNQVNEEGSTFAIVRLMSTHAKIVKILGSELKEGRWYRLQLGKSENEPPVWVFEEQGGFLLTPARTNLVELVDYGSPPDAPEIDAIRTFCTSSAVRSSTIHVDGSLLSSHQDAFIRVVDVGQASFCAIHERHDPDSPVLGYFDVGAPLSFHEKSFPSAFKEKARVPRSGFVSLSHWDFDHYAAARKKLPELQSLKWYAPVQEVGPVSAKFRKQLGAQLILLDTDTFDLTPNLKLWRGTGPLDDRNASGYVLRQTARGRNVLVAGDVPYAHVPAHAKQNLTALAITHHGGPSADSPPPPQISGATAAVSFGMPNYYRHPNEAFLDAHMNSGWKIQRTRPDASPRGDVWLV